MIDIILASGSPRRRELLKKLDIPFKVQKSNIREGDFKGRSPESFVKDVALAKACCVGKIFPSSLVIGADTIVTIEGKIIGKPTNPKEAHAILNELSGTTHDVLTGLALVWGDKTTVTYERTRVFFRPLTEAEIEAYVATGEPLDKAGAYGIQGRAAIFVRRIEGCFFNVVGLPLFSLQKMLSSFKIDIRDGEIVYGRKGDVQADIEGDACGGEAAGEAHQPGL